MFSLLYNAEVVYIKSKKCTVVKLVRKVDILNKFALANSTFKALYPI